jgi:hypothetical protein
VPYFAEGPPSWQIPNTSPFLALERSAQANNVANPFIMFDWLHTMGAQIDPTVQHDIRQVYPQTYADPGDFRQQLGDLVFTWGRAQVRYTIDPNGTNPTYEDSEVNFPGVGSLVQRLEALGITVVQNPTSITLTSRRGYFQITPIDCNIFNNGEGPVWEISTTPITISTVYPPSNNFDSFWSAGNEATIFDKVIDVRRRLAVEAGFINDYEDVHDITEDRIGLLRLTPQGLACTVGNPIGIDGNILINYEAYASQLQLYVKSRNAGYGVGPWTDFYFSSRTATSLIVPSRKAGATSPGIPWQNLFPTQIGDSIPTSSTMFQGAINAAYIPPGGPWGFSSGNYDNELMRASTGDPDFQSNGGYEADFWVNKWGGPNGVDASVRILGSPNKTPKFAIKPDGPNSSFVTLVQVAIDDVFRDQRNARFASTVPLSMGSPVNANADYLTSIKFDWESNTYIFAIPYFAKGLLNGGPGCGPFFHKIPKSAWLWNLLQWRLDSWTESICLCTQNLAPGLPGFFGTGYEPDFDLDAWYLDAAGYDLLSGQGVSASEVRTAFRPSISSFRLRTYRPGAASSASRRATGIRKTASRLSFRRWLRPV